MFAVTNLEAIDNDGNTIGWIENLMDEVIEEGAFTFESHEDEAIWDELADRELRRKGYVRIGPWEGHNVIFAPIERL